MQFDEESQYLSMADQIIRDGDIKDDRTGVGTYAQFGRQIRFDLSNRKIPVVTTRKLKPLDPIIEMLWFIAGDTDIAFLKENNINIWDSWVREETKRFDGDRLIGGSIGPGAYGAQWRKWEDTRIINNKDLSKYAGFGYKYVAPLNESQMENGSSKCVITRSIDQLATAIEMIKHSPDSRRIIVSAWNPGRFEDQALLPCHSLYQFYTYNLSYFQRMKMIETMHKYKQLPQLEYEQLDNMLGETKLHESNVAGKLNELAIDNITKILKLPTRGLKLHLFARSQDFLVGSCYNTLQYAALAHMVAQVTNTWATEFIWTGSDVHVYKDQIEGFKKQKCNKPLGGDIKLLINPDVHDIDGFTPTDFSVENYQHHQFIKYPIAV